MKKILLFVAVLMSAVVMQAQVLQVAPQSEVSKARATGFAKKAITAKEGQMWWGYFSGNEELGYLGTGAAETFDCAILVPANHEYVGSSSIKAIRFYLANASNVSMAKVWISKQQPGAIDNADFVQTVDPSTLVDGANDIELSTPFNVSNSAIYVGFSFTIKSPEYCIAMGGDYVNNSLYLRSSQNVTSWEAVTRYGKLALQLLLEGGNYPVNNASPEGFGPVVVGLGQTVKVPVKITNNGADPITSIAYTITSNGSTSKETSIETTPIPFGATEKVVIPIDADAAEGTNQITLTITKVNGKNNNASKTSAVCKLTTIANLKTFARNVLIEEFTTEYCGYCPDAAAGLSSFMSSNPDLASRVAVVCHHAGYGTDWLTIDASRNYTWFYNSGGTYAPAFMYDRFAWDGSTPVVSRGSYVDYVGTRAGETSYANINLTANFNAAKNAINVTADCERGWDFSSTPARITLFLTEDNIKAQSQAGAGGSFTHQHVLRKVNETWGTVLNWSDNKASYSYTFDLDSSWKTGDLKVVAMISAYDSNNPVNCVVENAASAVPGTDTGIAAYSSENLKETGRYSLNGSQMTAPQRGLNIIRMEDGTVKKVFVK